MHNLIDIGTANQLTRLNTWAPHSSRTQASGYFIIMARCQVV